jgi:hypothetical protein
MAALLSIYDPEPEAVLSVDGNSPLFVDQLQDIWRTVASRCRKSNVALHWKIADECRGLSLASSDLLHLAGVLHELETSAIDRRQARNLWVGFRCLSDNLIVVVENDGDDGLPAERSEACNIEYLTAQLAGRIRHRSRRHHQASLFWLPLGSTPHEARVPAMRSGCVELRGARGIRAQHG